MYQPLITNERLSVHLARKKEEEESGKEGVVHIVD